MLLNLNNKIFTKARLLYELDLVCQDYLKRLEIKAEIQVKDLPELLQICFVVDKAIESAVILTEQTSMADYIRDALRHKKLFKNNPEIKILTKIRR
jgi:DNA modification methylase